MSWILHSIVTSLWDSAFAQFGIAGLVLAGAIAAFIYVPSSGVRHLAVGVASVCCVFLFLGPKLYIEGVNHERTIWVAREQERVEAAEKARRDAEAEIPEVVTEPAVEPPPPAESTGGRGVLQRVLHPRAKPPRRVRVTDPNDRDQR